MILWYAPSSLQSTLPHPVTLKGKLTLLTTDCPRLRRILLPQLQRQRPPSQNCQRVGRIIHLRRPIPMRQPPQEQRHGRPPRQNGNTAPTPSISRDHGADLRQHHLYQGSSYPKVLRSSHDVRPLQIRDRDNRKPAGYPSQHPRTPPCLPELPA